MSTWYRLPCMNAAMPLAGAQLKIARAKQQVREVLATYKQFMAQDPYKVTAKRDEEGRPQYYLVDITPDLPVVISAVVGDILHNLRGALDHVAYQLWLRGGGQGDGKHVYFPIFDSAEKFAHASPGKVQGMTQAAIDAISALKPYKGGNDALWRLHALDIIDKHRLLVTVGSLFRSVDVGPTLRRFAKEAAAVLGVPEDEIPTIRMPLIPADNLCPLKKGDVLYIDQAGAEFVQGMAFGFEMALHEPSVCTGVPIRGLIGESMQAVEGAIQALAPHLE